MTAKVTPSEYLVISRGQWDKEVTPEKIQSAIDNFYLWHDRLVGEGKMKAGQRLAPEGKRVSEIGFASGRTLQSQPLTIGFGENQNE